LYYEWTETEVEVLVARKKSDIINVNP
jgi:hypothetical protein